MKFAAESESSQWLPYVIVALVLCALWIGVILLWGSGGGSDRVKRNMERNIGRFFSSRWIKERIYLVATPIAVVATIAFLPVPIIWILDYKEGTMPVFIGLLLIVPFAVGPVLAVVFCVSVVRNGKPKFLVPPADRDQPTGLELKRRYESKARKKRRR